MSKFNGKALTDFQRKLYGALKFRRWYNVFPGQGQSKFDLPGWFHRKQGEPWDTIRPMLEAGVIRKKLQESTPGGAKLPLIRKCRPTTTGPE